MTVKKTKKPVITGSRIARLRERMKLDVGYLAIALDVHQSSVYRWEGTMRPRLRLTTISIILALEARGDDDLRLLGNAIANACRAENRLEAVRLLVEVATAVPVTTTEST